MKLILHRLSLVNHGVRSSVLRSLTTAFDPNPALASFGPPLQIRQLQVNMGFLIAGSFAYEFLRCGIYARPKELEIFAYRIHAGDLAEYFVSLGYSPFLSLPEEQIYNTLGPRRFLEDSMWRTAKFYNDTTPSCGVWVFNHKTSSLRIILHAARHTPLMCLLDTAFSK